MVAVLILRHFEKYCARSAAARVFTPCPTHSAAGAGATVAEASYRSELAAPCEMQGQS
jgi:hypothetical protein